jgi:hypothetical protein
MVIFNVLSPLVEKDEGIFKIGFYIWIQHFGICQKSTKCFEKGDMYFGIHILFNIVLFNILTLQG